MKMKTQANYLKRTERVLKRIMPNRKYKDALFWFIFQDKEKLLSLYNALNNSHYTNSVSYRY